MALMPNDMMHAYGKKIFQHSPLLVKAEKTWRERLISWPWKPWVKYRYEYKDLLKDGTVFMFGDNMLVNTSTMHKFRSVINHNNMS